MRKYIFILLTLCFVLLQTEDGHAQKQKLAQSGFKFLSLSTDARMSAIGEAATSLNSMSAAMLYNPAGMARLAEYIGVAEISLNQTQWIADINYITGTAAVAPMDGLFGVFGVSFSYVDYGDFQRTIRAQNELGYLDLGTFKPYSFSIGVGYAKALSEKFSVGGNIKYAKQDLGQNHITDVTGTGEYVKKDFALDVLAFDFGILYETGYKSLKLGMSVRNFSQEIQYEEEGFQLPLTFTIGMSADALDFLMPEVDKSMHSLLVTVDATHPRDYPEQLRFGVDYTFMDILSLRAGYYFPHDEGGFTAGVGLQKDLAGVNLGFDYAYAPFGVFDDVHRLTVHFGL